MNRQQSYQQNGGRVAAVMQGNPRPTTRLVMTAPRPRLQRRLNEGERSSNSSFDKSDPAEEIIHKSLFAPPIVVQHEIFRMEMPANNHHNRQMIHRSTSGGCSIQPILGTPSKKITGRRACSTVKRTGNDKFCGLSAEISREIAYRTPMKTPAKTPGKTTDRSIMNTPVSRDLFRANPAAPMGDSKLMNIQLTQTASMSISEGGSSPQESCVMPSAKQPVETKKGEPTSLLSTPKTKSKKQKIRKTPFPKMSGRKKLKRALTPPRNTFGSHAKPTRASSAAAATLLNAMSTSYDGVNDFRLTSTEQDPASFQVELPAKKEMLVHSRICALMDGYTAIHRDFNFAMLSGVSHLTLEKEYGRSTEDKPMIAGSCHRDVVQKLLACADDIVVEGFFREYTEEEKDMESTRVEVCIFSSESLRQIIVCFRGSTSNQAKPLRSNTLFGKKVSGSCILHEEQGVHILDAFRSVYFGTSLETTAFALLANLAARKPFFDIVMTGHSFGAAMATIASLRYASSNSQMRVSCHVFGSPRIGGEEWRQLVHSVPNLRICRAENSSDPYVLMPSGNEWVQCGHAIQICDDVSDGNAGIQFKARRFDRDQPAFTHNNLLGFVQAKVLSQGSAQGKVDHEIQSYVEKIASSGEQWFADFCEVKGEGVSGDNNERRLLA